MDKLKEYLQNNRDKLDIYKPDGIEFEKILSEVKGQPKPPKIKRYWWIGIAASIVLGLIISHIAYKNDPRNVIREKEVATISQRKIVAKDSVVKYEEQSTVNENAPLAHKVDHTENILAGVNKEKKSNDVQLKKVKEIDSINLVYKKIINKYLIDINRVLASDQVELKEVNRQLQEMELDEEKIRGLIREFGPKENLIEAMIRLNQQKIIYLKRVYQPLVKREKFL
ncbi:hypothetical protein AY601_1119 [Pedobacter cryoconitis]|uniref:Uncharacterized protein n=1 Tax=Pedobacter cryoconitis TaxID=188932 RepID=A0A127V9M3_9SPHI|nr:hypothetical protein [Pedobacter cryoconitis]AMP98046.1 hypothetical protein AY601_1119 [Pedobacter cryoconitis]